MNETAQREPDLTIGDYNTPIHPHVMKEMQRLNDRINIQNETMQAMWGRVQPATKFYEWVKETHPDILNQYVSIRELEEVGKSSEGRVMPSKGILRGNL